MKLKLKRDGYIFLIKFYLMKRLICTLILIFPVITNAQVVTSGLVLHVDANDPNSYSGSGNTWTDLTGNGNNIILNGPTFRSTNETVAKYFEFVIIMENHSQITPTPSQKHPTIIPKSPPKSYPTQP